MRAACGFVLTALAAGTFFVADRSPARASENLSVCLEANSAPYSFKHGKEIGGFDLAVAQAIAKRLDRTLMIQWFEVSAQPDGDKPSPNNAKDALLSDGKCQLVAGYPLTTDSFIRQVEWSKFPDFDGAKPEDRRRRVTLQEMAPTEAYQFLPMTVVLGPKVADLKIHSLNDLKGVKLGGESSTLPNAILTMYTGHELSGQVEHITPGVSLERGGGLLERLERGDYDATLIELHRFDAYRKEHPDTKLKLSGYYHSVGFSMGFAALKSETALIDAVNHAIDEMKAKNEFAALAGAEGMTYIAPHDPEMRGPVGFGELSHD